MSFAPSFANLRDVARPIPEPPPVTSATFPCSSPAMTEPPRGPPRRLNLRLPRIDTRARTARCANAFDEHRSVPNFLNSALAFYAFVATLLDHLEHPSGELPSAPDSPGSSPASGSEKPGNSRSRLAFTVHGRVLLTGESLVDAVRFRASRSIAASIPTTV